MKGEWNKNESNKNNIAPLIRSKKSPRASLGLFLVKSASDA